MLCKTKPRHCARRLAFHRFQDGIGHYPNKLSLLSGGKCQKPKQDDDGHPLDGQLRAANTVVQQQMQLTPRVSTSSQRHFCLSAPGYFTK